MTTKIIFLDFDGVLNYQSFCEERVKEVNLKIKDKTCYMSDQICEMAVNRLNNIIRRTGAVCVISSTWRLGFPFYKLEEFLKSKGFIGQVIGETPILQIEREFEIRQYMDQNQINSDQIIILDDIFNFGHLEHRHVLTTFQSGLQDEHVEKAVALLGEVNELL